jgi:hypothetical protein
MVPVLVVDVSEVDVVPVLVEDVSEVDAVAVLEEMVDVLLKSTQVVLTAAVIELLHLNGYFALQAGTQAPAAHDEAATVPLLVGVQLGPSQQ